MEAGLFGNFEASSLSPEQYAIFLSTIATLASNGVKVRTLYVWESDADRHLYIYTESGKVIASYPPPDGYDPYKLSRRQLEGETALDQEQGEELINSLDPSRVILRVEVTEGPVPIALPILQPELSEAAVLPGGFGTLQGGGEPALSLTTLSQQPAFDWVLRLNSPGIDTWIPIWRANDLTLPATGWGTPDTRTISTAADSILKDISDEHSSGLRLRYYFTPYLDTTYVQAPGPQSLTVKYVTTRNISPTAYLWKPGWWAGGASKPAAQVPNGGLGSGVYVYEASFSNQDFVGKVPDHMEPGTIYKYTFEWAAGADTFRTSVPTVRTWPNPGSIGDFSFIAYGDSRYKDSSTTFNADHRDVACLGILGSPRPESNGAPPAFVLHVGDLVYEGGQANQWIPHFFRPAGALLGRVPVFPCIGNHDWDPNGLGVAKYTALFKLPSENERWYSFDYGKCHFICLDAYSDFSPTSDQYHWLIKGGGQDAGDLPQAWRGKTVYGTVDRIFVYMHFPPYSSGPHGTEQDPKKLDYQKRMDLRAYLVPKFEKYGVDMVFTGHEHLYERVSKGGIQYVVTGGGGAPGHSINLGWNYDGTPGAVRQASYDQNRTDRGDWHHYCRVNVSADGAVGVNVWNNEHSLLDCLEIP